MIADKRDPAHGREATCYTCEQVEVDCECNMPVAKATPASIGALAREAEDIAYAIRVYTTRDAVDPAELFRLIARLDSAVCHLREDLADLEGAA